MQRLMLAALLRRPWGPAAWSLYYKSLYPGQQPGDLSDYRAVLKAHLKEPGRFHALKSMVSASKAGSEARLATVKAPVLVVMGSKDPDFPNPADEAQFVADRLNGTTHLVEGAGHYPHAERPEETAARLLTFLDSIRPLEVAVRGR